MLVRFPPAEMTVQSLLMEVAIFTVPALSLWAYLRHVADQRLRRGIPLALAITLRIALAALSPVTCVFVAAVIACCAVRAVAKTLTMPPGPISFPVTGYLPWINNYFHLTLLEVSKKYGKVCSLMMGQTTVIVLSDFDVIKKAFGMGIFTGKPKSDLYKPLGKFGIINTEGDLWRQQRNYLLKNHIGLRPTNVHGHVFRRVDSSLSNEVVHMLEVIFKQHDGNPFEPSDLLGASAANVICAAVMSTRFRHDNYEFKSFMKNFDDGFELFTSIGLANFVPALKYLPGVDSKVKQLEVNHGKMLKFARKVINEHRADLDLANPRDLVDAYLVEMAKAGEALKELGIDGDSQLEQVILDLFSAGVETVKTALTWSILYMLHFPEVKEKIQRELDSVVGEDRLPEYEDKERLPYTWAAICEILRRASIVPLGTTHSTFSECKLEGYTIPQGAHVIPHIYAVHMNPDFFPDPEEYRPERFLSPEGKFTQPQQFMPFGVGMRRCLGDKLAEKELFLFFSSLIHMFDVTSLSPSLPGLSGKCEVTHSPHEFQIVCVPRKADTLIRLIQANAAKAFPSHIRTYG